MTVQGVIYYFQHLPFNLAGGEQDFQEQREGLPLIVNMLEPWMVAGGFQASLLIPTDGRTREFFSADSMPRRTAVESLPWLH